MSNLAQKLDDAEATGFQGNYIEPGLHLLEVDRIIERNGYKGHSVVAEFLVVKSSNPDHVPGEKVSDVHKINKAIQVGNLKAFVLKLFEEAGVLEDYQEAEKDQRLQMIEAVYDGDGTQFQGFQVFCEAVPTVTKKGNDFTRLNYDVYDPDRHDERIQKSTEAREALAEEELEDEEESDGGLDMNLPNS